MIMTYAPCSSVGIPGCGRDSACGEGLQLLRRFLRLSEQNSPQDQIHSAGGECGRICEGW